MVDGHEHERLGFTEAEAFALLTICTLYEHPLDAVSESAVQKLAKYCQRDWIDPESTVAPVDSDLASAR